MFLLPMLFLQSKSSNSISVNNLATRSVTATFFVIVMVGAMLLGQLATALLFLLITIFSIDEFVKLSHKTGAETNCTVSIITGTIVYMLIAAFALFPLDGRWLMLILPLLLMVMIIELFRKAANPFGNIAWTILSVIYIALPFALLIHFFGKDPAGWQERSGTILGFFTILWLNDTGAYFVGSVAGKHKLFERISPKKTWEGSAGGFIIALLTAWGISFLFTQFGLLQWLSIALVIVVFGTLGDLVESMFKRSIGIKDSGDILPGHGGLLDRFDAVLVASPFVFALLTFFN